VAEERTELERAGAVEARLAALEGELSAARAELERTRLEDTLTGCLSRAGLTRAYERLRGGGGPLIGRSPSACGSRWRWSPSSGISARSR
jgi:hypothetical protein